MSDLRIAVAGAAGRMGAANIRTIAATLGVALVAAIDRPDSSAIGRDSGALSGLEPNGIPIHANASRALDEVDAVLDFTVPSATMALLDDVAERELIHIIGTTGLDADQEARIAAATIAGARVVKAGNFSLGLNLLLGLVRQASAALPGYDIEILEMHHRNKIDAPSGTALMLGQAAAEGRNVDLDAVSVRSRDGHTGARPEGAIGFATLRGGTVVGEHSVMLAGTNERIELVHHAENREMFAQGAVRAALWARDRAPGLYSMADVLGFTSGN